MVGSGSSGAVAIKPGSRTVDSPDMATIIDDGGVEIPPPTTGTNGNGTIERRACRRTRVHGEAQIEFDLADHASVAGRVQFIDASVSGLGVRCTEPAPVGSRFTLFPDKVRASSWTGEVVRCVAADGAYTLGLALSAAAA